MFVAIYPESGPVKNFELKEIQRLPGEFFAFEIIENRNGDNSDSVIPIDLKGNQIKLIIGQYELIDIKKGNSYRPYVFTIYSSESKKIYSLSSTSNVIEWALSQSINLIIKGSKYPSWPDFQNSLKVVELKDQLSTLKQENINLKNERDLILKELDELKNQLLAKK